MHLKLGKPRPKRKSAGICKKQQKYK